MKFKSIELEQVAGFKSQWPDRSIEEIAFVGRSNVGKSSFINAFLGRKNLARTSSKPGKTRTINFYNIDSKFRLVDLPGYGYAKVSKVEKSKWDKLINEYLHQRENLKEVFLLVDIRHDPTDLDCKMYEWIIDSGFTGFVIATKYDKISKNQLHKHINAIKKKLNIEDEGLIFAYSSENKHNLGVIHEQVEVIINN
ncbi:MULTISPECIES: ribosome biogenesis GTP-binding protein YihA/YsxC [Anaerococcus]|jgi:ribosome biogenesis GTP-binding protein ysxC|uniref:Probable GTP-binding protein EngB n=1 Tax=Anaerococcus nagyae TaxID=1755241 RepID=A0A3E2THU5_9FIRM|nr:MULTISPECIES: ribosome biogenesis GTP-binding protein YihA/YsxC [Anaerococcus]MBP2068864.1 GTP-binding protein [Anaerococcus nagyae]MDU1828696.1 ribosome biogenesis GTP-binding protein YihA/YsxC [Anaerococcus sp.]MDU1865205.1 ribosome biogenesis GTP-binding protein YihA/YsxC [Anaerococcus sp.]MDU2352987.1 ribosome biogenesis GTP-binding protein YihA/YsxC [Anaerococcus sp.]MDU2566001.1 ribosome biogenesis GTP-binding protein YihA/YsxC [Anaerococcus sp.]